MLTYLIRAEWSDLTDKSLNLIDKQQHQISIRYNNEAFYHMDPDLDQ